MTTEDILILVIGGTIALTVVLYVAGWVIGIVGGIAGAVAERSAENRAKRQLEIAALARQVQGSPAQTGQDMGRLGEAQREREMCAQYGHAWITGVTSGDTYCRCCGEAAADPEGQE